MDYLENLVLADCQVDWEVKETRVKQVTVADYWLDKKVNLVAMVCRDHVVFQDLKVILEHLVQKVKWGQW